MDRSSTAEDGRGRLEECGSFPLKLYVLYCQTLSGRYRIAACTLLLYSKTFVLFYSAKGLLERKEKKG